MRLKLACADFTFPLLPHDHVLDLIAMLKLKGVDIGLFEDRSHLQPSREFENVRRSARRLKKKLEARGLVAADVFMQTALDFESYAINNPQTRRRNKARDWFLKTLEYALECGSKHVSGLPGVHFRDEKRGDSWARSVEELSWRVEQARQHRIIYGVEPHIGSLASHPKSAARLVRDVPGLTLTLDYSHFIPRGIPESEVEVLIQHASHFHVRGACRGNGQANFERNTLDFGRILEVMRASGYRGWLELEYCWGEGYEGCDVLAETIRFRDHLRALAA